MILIRCDREHFVDKHQLSRAPVSSDTISYKPYSLHHIPRNLALRNSIAKNKHASFIVTILIEDIRIIHLANYFL